jgi:hypothetical protein
VIDGFLGMRTVVRYLRSVGCKLLIARTFEEALRAVKNEKFDVAIVDIAWVADKRIPQHEQLDAGWDLSDKIEEADASTGRQGTPQIICSNRFDTKPDLIYEAVRRKHLPVLKSYDENGGRSLKVAIDYLFTTRSQRPKSREDFLELIAAELKTAFVGSVTKNSESYRRWERIAIPAAAFVVILIILGVVFTALGHIEFKTIEGLASLVASALGALL